MTDQRLYLTVAEAAERMGRSERTIRRWMNARLLAVYRRSGDGNLVLDIAELVRVERAQRRRESARKRRADAMLAKLQSMSYPRD